MYTIDTNIIIYYRNGEPAVVSFLHEQLENGAPLYVSSITEHELFSYPRLTEIETERIDDVLMTMTVIDVDSRMARFAGYLRAHHGVKALDSFIAATALMTGSALVTRNIRDFRRIPSLTVLEL